MYRPKCEFAPAPEPIDYAMMMEKVRALFNGVSGLMDDAKQSKNMDHLVTLSIIQKQLYDIYCRYRSLTTKMPIAPQEFRTVSIKQ